MLAGAATTIMKTSISYRPRIPIEERMSWWRRFLIVGPLIMCLSAIWLFTGIYQDRECSFYYAFVKHRPSPKFFFYSPLGVSAAGIESLSPKLQEEERAYRDFVVDHRSHFQRTLVWQ